MLSSFLLTYPWNKWQKGRDKCSLFVIFPLCLLSPRINGRMEGIKSRTAKCKTNEKEPSVKWPFCWPAFEKRHKAQTQSLVITDSEQFNITLLPRPVVCLLALTIDKGILALLPDSWEIPLKFQYPPALWGVKLPMRGQLPLAHPWQSLPVLKGIPSAAQAEPREFLLQEKDKELLPQTNTAWVWDLDSWETLQGTEGPGLGISTIGSSLSVDCRKYERWNFSIYFLRGIFKSCFSTTSRSSS